MLKRQYPKTLDELIFINSDIFNQKYEFNLYSNLNTARTGTIEAKKRVEHIIKHAEERQNKTGKIVFLRENQNKLFDLIKKEQSGFNLKHSLKCRFPFILTGESTDKTETRKIGVNPQDYNHLFSNSILSFLQFQLSNNENFKDTLNKFAFFYIQPQFKIQIPIVRNDKVLLVDYLNGLTKSTTNYNDTEDEYDLKLLSDSAFHKAFEEMYSVFDILDSQIRQERIESIIRAASKFCYEEFDSQDFTQYHLDLIGKAHSTYTKVSREIMGMSLNIFLDEIYKLVRPTIQELEIKSLKKLMGLTSYDQEIMDFALKHSTNYEMTSFIAGDKGIYAPQQSKKGICELKPTKLLLNYIKHFHFSDFNEKLNDLKFEPANIVCNSSSKHGRKPYLRQNNLMLNNEESFFTFFDKGELTKLKSFKKGYSISDLALFLKGKKTNISRIEDLLVEFFTKDRKMYSDFYTINKEFTMFQSYLSDKEILTFEQLELSYSDSVIYPILLEAIEDSASQFYFEKYFSSSFFSSKVWGHGKPHTVDDDFISRIKDDKNLTFYGCPNFFRLSKLSESEKSGLINRELNRLAEENIAYKDEFFQDHDKFGKSFMSIYSQMVHELVLSNLHGVDHSQVTKQIGLNAPVTDYAEFDLSLDMKVADKRIRRMSRPDTILFLKSENEVDVLVLDLKLNQITNHSRHHYIMQNLDAGLMAKNIWNRIHPESKIRFNSVISGNIHTPHIGYDQKVNTSNIYLDMKFSTLNRIPFDHPVFDFFKEAMEKQFEYYEKKAPLDYRSAAGEKCKECFIADRYACESMLNIYKKRQENK